MPEPDLRPTLTTLPEGTGVYRMLDAAGDILYIGKAVNLKKRVTQYFQKTTTHPKTIALVQRIHAIEVTLTRTETEALLLENTLIKRHRPKYNILLRDDKTYPYLWLDLAHPFPSLVIRRLKRLPQTGKVFGPHPNTQAVHHALNVLQKCFKLRNCTEATFRTRSRPCLQYQIKRCTAPCTGLIAKEAYAKNVAHAIAFLQGKSTQLLTALTHEMENAVSRLAFEDAACLRDQIQQLRLMQQSQAIMHEAKNSDLIVIQWIHGIACIEHVMIRQGNIVHNQAYFPTVPALMLEADLLKQQISLFEAFVRFYYLDQLEAIPDVILIDPMLPEEVLQPYECLFKQLTERACRVTTPRKAFEKEWVAFAQHNLTLHVTQRLQQQTTFQSQFQALQKQLSLPGAIQSIACIDVSHLQGQATYAAYVVFGLDGPCRSAYRRFAINGLDSPGDDYAAMKQAVFKSLHALKACPDLLLLDGGKGQVNAALSVLEQLGLSVSVLGITKGLHRHARYDRIYDAKHATFLDLSWHDETLHLLQQLRDEAHRVAIAMHRVRRSKEHLASTLDHVQGIGPQRRKRLLQHFGGMQGLSQASYEALRAVPGMSHVLANRVKTHLEGDQAP